MIHNIAKKWKTNNCSRISQFKWKLALTVWIIVPNLLSKKQNKLMKKLRYQVIRTLETKNIEQKSVKHQE